MSLFLLVEIESKDTYQRIVYDSQAISKLLDRSKMMADSEETVPAFDEYLSAFRVAHFDEMNAEPVDCFVTKNNEEQVNRMEISEKNPESVNPTMVTDGTYTEVWLVLLRSIFLRSAVDFITNEFRLIFSMGSRRLLNFVEIIYRSKSVHLKPRSTR